jgi:hypothetical protein
MPARKQTLPDPTTLELEIVFPNARAVPARVLTLVPN